MLDEEEEVLNETSNDSIYNIGSSGEAGAKCIIECIQERIEERSKNEEK